MADAVVTRRFAVEPSHVLPERWHVRDHATGQVARYRPYRCRHQRLALFADRIQAQQVCDQLEAAASTSSPAPVHRDAAMTPTGGGVDGSASATSAPTSATGPTHTRNAP